MNLTQANQNIRNLKNANALRLHFAILLILSLLYFIPIPTHFQLIISGIIVFITYLFIGITEGKNSTLFFTPISAYFFWYSINLGLSTAFYGLQIAENYTIFFGPKIIDPGSIELGFIIYLLGSFFFHLGLELFKPKIIKDQIQSTLKFSTVKTAFIISVLFFIYGDIFLPLGAILNSINFFSLSALVLYGIGKIEDLNISNKQKLQGLLIGCAILFFLTIQTTSKQTMMYSFLPLIWFGIFQKHYKKYLFVAVIFLLPLYLFFVQPISTELRYQIWHGRQPDLIEATQNVVEGNISTISYDDRNGIEVFLYRSSIIIPTAFITQNVELHGFQYGKTLGYLAFSLIPRIFWPSKPNVTQSAWFTYYLGISSSPETSTSATGITSVGELYWNFSYPGVIAGMFFLGMGFSLLWRLTVNLRSSLLSMALYIIIMYSMREIAEFGTTLISFVTMFIFFKFSFFIRDSHLIKGKKKIARLSGEITH